MYESFFKLSAKPFRLVPDARFFYPSSVHKRGLAYLRYGIDQGQGFVVVTGRPGTGKSTLVQTMFNDFLSESLVVANIASSNLGADDILRAVGHSFNVYGDGKSKVTLLLAIENFLKSKSRQGKRVILIVDEAHNLQKMALEELRMLSNFHDDNRTLLQIVLLGQQELLDMLSRPDMEQLSQRVIASCHLKPLGAEDTRAYIEHRLQCTGWRGDPQITSEALDIIYTASYGIPRTINVFCDRLLLSAAVDEVHTIDSVRAHTVLAELEDESAGVFRSLNHGAEAFELPPLTGEGVAQLDEVKAVAPDSESDTDTVGYAQQQGVVSAPTVSDDEVGVDNDGVNIPISDVDALITANRSEVAEPQVSEQAQPAREDAPVYASFDEEALLQKYPELQAGSTPSSGRLKRLVKLFFSLIAIAALMIFLFADDIKNLVRIGHTLISEKTGLLAPPVSPQPSETDVIMVPENSPQLEKSPPAIPPVILEEQGSLPGTGIEAETDIIAAPENTSQPESSSILEAQDSQPVTGLVPDANVETADDLVEETLDIE